MSSLLGERRSRTVDNDSCPGIRLGKLTLRRRSAEYFTQMVPVGDRAYRTMRGDRDLQIWLLKDATSVHRTTARRRGQNYWGPNKGLA